MKIQVTCPKCNKTYTLSSDFCGKKVSCQECATTFRLGPAPPSKPVTQVSDDMLMPDPAQQPSAGFSQGSKIRQQAKLGNLNRPTERARSPHPNQPQNAPPKSRLHAGYNQPSLNTAGLKQCRACMKNINQHATRCPFCTEHQTSMAQTRRGYDQTTQESSGSSSGLITSGYLCGALSLLCCPPFLALAGIIIGIVNMTKGSVGHGIAQILISIVCGSIGTIIGAIIGSTWNI